MPEQKKEKEKREVDISDFLDFIFTTFNECFIQGKFEVVDKIIASYTNEEDILRMNDYIIVGILCASLPAYGHLPNRKLFFDKAKEYFIETRGEEEAKSLLNGLEIYKPSRFY